MIDTIAKICRNCGQTIYFSQKARKWVTQRVTKRGTIQEHWHCGNDPAFPVRVHSPKDETDGTDQQGRDGDPQAAA